MRHNAIVSQHQLDCYLRDSNIHYFDAGIATDGKYLDRILLAENKHEVFHNEELQRISSTIEQMLNEVYQCEDDTIVLFRCGVLHLKRLTAYLSRKIDQENNPNFSIHIHTMNVHSKYVADNHEDMLSHLLHSIEEESPEMFALSSQVNVIDAPAIERANGDFQCAVMDTTVCQILSKQKCCYFIPRLKFERALFPECYHDSIAEVDDGYSIKLPADFLNKQVRETLSLKRVRITLVNEYLPQQLEWLQQQSVITLEKSKLPRQFVLTYPEELNDTITHVIYKWPEFSLNKKTGPVPFS